MKCHLEIMKNEQADKQEHPHPAGPEFLRRAVGPEILRGYKNIVASLLIFVEILVLEGEKNRNALYAH